MSYNGAYISKSIFNTILNDTFLENHIFVDFENLNDFVLNINLHEIRYNREQFLCLIYIAKNAENINYNFLTDIRYIIENEDSNLGIVFPREIRNVTQLKFGLLNIKQKEYYNIDGSKSNEAVFFIFN